MSSGLPKYYIHAQTHAQFEKKNKLKNRESEMAQWVKAVATNARQPELRAQSPQKSSAMVLHSHHGTHVPVVERHGVNPQEPGHGGQYL